MRDRNKYTALYILYSTAQLWLADMHGLLCTVSSTSIPASVCASSSYFLSVSISHVMQNIWSKAKEISLS